MDILVLSLNIILPLFLSIGLGYYIKKINLIDDHAIEIINKLTFTIFLPLVLFYNIYTSDIGESFDFNLLLFALITVTLIFILALVLIPKLEKDHTLCGVMAQAMFRSNFIIFGIPIASALGGAAAVGTTTILIAVIVPYFNILAVVCFEVFRKGKVDGKKIIKGIITNPLIIASFFGFLLLFLKIQLPFAIEKTILDLSKIATPLALVTLGSSFCFSAAKQYTKQIKITIFASLFLSPIIFITLAILLGFRDSSLIALIPMYAAPPAVSSFTMAKQLGGNQELAGILIVIGTLISAFTLFFFISILKAFSFI
ncbi:MAG: AEC family transporter [Oscillospiraceae bacterium]